MKDEVVFKSIWEIHVNDQIITVNTESDARKKFRSLVANETNNQGYLYRKDYNKKGKFIEVYMIA